MTTVSMFLPSMSGTTGNKLWLYKSSDYSLVNAGGDALVESGTSGWFTATVDEAWTETLSATVLDTNSLASGYGWLAVGATQISDGTAVLDSAARVKLAADQPDYAPALEPELRGGLTLAESVDLLIAGIAGVNSQPDSDTEKFKFVDGNDAFTTTFDTSGNRASVVLH